MKIKFEGLYFIGGHFQGYMNTTVEASNIKDAEKVLKNKVNNKRNAPVKFKGVFQKIKF